jgi:hypothetical protein
MNTSSTAIARSAATFERLGPIVDWVVELSLRLLVKDLPNHADNDVAPVASVRREQRSEFGYLSVPGHGGRAHQAEQRRKASPAGSATLRRTGASIVTGTVSMSVSDPLLSYRIIAFLC